MTIERFARCRFNGHMMKGNTMTKKTATKAKASNATIASVEKINEQNAITANAPVIAATHAIDPSRIKIKRQVVLPLLSMKNGDKAILKINKPFYVGKVIEGATIKKAADLAEVTNIETGQLMTMIVSKVLFSTITEDEVYAKNGYVGKIFAIERVAPKEGKKYPTFGVVEVEIED